mmetsp:Transcript_43600/g.52740  ORF Transcript_43600/g.52740 Transcript_43600/m.52740 type:complete len:500 (-) Transcript_43600:385-1884(-)|eukprot:CAMPEP_0197844908 /NCGR_PEP_ID=MMETSP1438-20131217/1883_1 /TAXON_ID=1461541 /ORGANISM="Pterosperma sp., Strain CCMP1384" /LENGTH=499 /DNA_ID=CAMNT_0043455941 /DNA_START=119 /DNA_END=1618 /DNA_ORIENTATION=-
MRKILLALSTGILFLTLLAVWQWNSAHTQHRDNPFVKEAIEQAALRNKLREYGAKGTRHAIGHEEHRFFSEVETRVADRHDPQDWASAQGDELDEAGESEELESEEEPEEEVDRSTSLTVEDVPEHREKHTTPQLAKHHSSTNTHTLEKEEKKEEKKKEHKESKEENKKDDKKEDKKDDKEEKDKTRSKSSGGSKSTQMYYNMFKDGFTGAFVMNKAKYKSESKGSPVRVAKFMIQCLDKSPPRGCDAKAAKLNPPRGRGWQRVARISKEFLALLPETDTLRDRLETKRKYTSCAVVGNGGSLLLYEAGAEIDRHEAVLRFNGGITKKFEKYVGSKTTIRLANTQHMGFHEKEDEIVLQHITMEGAMDKLAAVRQKHPKLELYATDGDFHQYVLDTMGDGAASNGFFGMVLAYELCERVTLYGFHKNWKKGAKDIGIAKTKYHYYDEIEPNESQSKRDDAETPRLFAFLDKHKDIFSFGEQELEKHMENSKETELYVKD